MKENNTFADVKNKLGFGCMRFPQKADRDVDTDMVCQMVDRFIEAGFNYFDTAHGYIERRSQNAVKTCLTSRHPRSSYLLADKLSNAFFEKQEDIVPLFNLQLEECGVDYFDYYLMHALNGESYKKYVECRAFETAAQLKAEGKIRHIGMSFHDSAQVLRKILSEREEIEFVQLQINYLDWNSESVQSRLCYEVCCEFAKPVIVMEPVKGGNLSQLIPQAQAVFDRLPERKSNASYAMRFAASLENVALVLSGMSDPDQVEDNIKTFSALKPLDDEEKKAVDEVVSILEKTGAIACTGCNYCTEVCPVGMPVPDIFLLMNGRTERSYAEITKKRKASECLQCGKCEKACPQHLPIRRYLGNAAFRLEK